MIFGKKTPLGHFIYSLREIRNAVICFYRDGFPYYYDTLRNVYTESPWESQYKYMVLKGMNDRTTVVNVSVTVLFSPEVFYGAMLRSYDFGPQILAAYLIRVISILSYLISSTLS